MTMNAIPLRLRRLLSVAFIGALFLAGTPALPQEWFATSPANGGFRSFDGQRFLVAGGESQPPSLWNLTTGSIMRTFQGHTEPVWQVAFSPDGIRVATVAAANVKKLQTVYG